MMLISRQWMHIPRTLVALNKHMERFSKKDLFGQASERIGFDLKKRYPWIFSYYAEQSRQPHLRAAKSFTRAEVEAFNKWLFG